MQASSIKNKNNSSGALLNLSGPRRFIKCGSTKRYIMTVDIV
jgi:hypothetical protein